MEEPRRAARIFAFRIVCGVRLTVRFCLGMIGVFLACTHITCNTYMACSQDYCHFGLNFTCIFYGTLQCETLIGMASENEPRKIELVFFRNDAGGEPVRDWLKGLDEAERRAIGTDLLRAQWRWPIGMPLCRPMGRGLWEVRTDLEGNRTARVLVCFYRDHLVALHGFIKKTRATPEDDLTLARKRQKELKQ